MEYVTKIERNQKDFIILQEMDYSTYKSQNNRKCIVYDKEYGEFVYKDFEN